MNNIYNRINIQAFNSIPGVPALISGSELLSSINPQISGSFLRYAEALVEKSLATQGINSDVESGYADLASASQYSSNATPQQLEAFADSLIAAADGPMAIVLYELAYLAYACTSIYGPISKRVQNKIQKIEPTLTQKTQDLSANSDSLSRTVFFLPNDTPFQFPKNNVPNFSFPAPTTSDSSTSLPPFMQTSSITLSLGPNQQKALDLVELAKVQFKQGSKEVAYSAMIAAIKELENCS